MARVFINKGTPRDKEWLGAAIFHDDGSLELLGAFVPLADDDQLSTYKEMWEENPHNQMQVGWMMDESDELLESESASPELVSEVQNAKYAGAAAKAKVVIK